MSVGALIRTPSPAAPGTAGDALLNALPQPVMLILEDGAIAFVNQAAQAFFHAGAPSMTGQPVAAFLPFGSAMLSVIDKARSDAAPAKWRSLSAPSVVSRTWAACRMPCS